MKVDPKLLRPHSRADLVPSLPEEEYRLLRDDIAARGIQVPLVVRDKESLVLLCGHQRLRVALELGLAEVPVLVGSLNGTSEVEYMILDNLRRRQLSPLQRAKLGLKLEALEGEKARERMLAGKTLGPIGPRVEQGKTLELAARKVGLSEQTYRRARKVALAAEAGNRRAQELREKVNAGELTVSAAAKQLRMVPEKRMTQAIEESLLSPGSLAHNVIIGDARDILPLLPPGSVDLVVTSPPYFGLKNYQHDLGVNLQDFHVYLGDLGAVFAGCHRALREGAFLCVVVGQYTSNNGSYYIPGHIAALLEGVGFRFAREHIWVKPLGVQGIWNHGTTSFLYEPWPRNTMVNVHHEHILIYQKGDRAQVFPGRDALSEKEVKEYCWSVWQLLPSPLKEHPAPFPLEIPERLVRMYSYEREVVLDPFLGAGTSIQAAKALNRRGLGIEVEPKYLPLIQRVTGGVNVIRHDQGQPPDFDYLVAGGGSLEVAHL